MTSTVEEACSRTPREKPSIFGLAYDSAARELKAISALFLSSRIVKWP
jgi:hypothetical protein